MAVYWTICLIATWFASILQVSSPEIFTSSLKVQKMVTEERHLLEEFKRFIDHQEERVKFYSEFYQKRLEYVDKMEKLKQIKELVHPNAVYSAIKRFAMDYSYVLGEHFDSFRENVKNGDETYIADFDDIKGARLSLLRLQSVYSLSAKDMVKGDYLGYKGPPLNHADAYDIGQIAFTEGKLNQSVDWLNASLAIFTGDRNSNTQYPTYGSIKALLGRVYIFRGDRDMALKIYDEAILLDPLAGDVVELGKEVNQIVDFRPLPPQDYYQNFSYLCSLENKHHPSTVNDPRIRCRYKAGYLPYYRFKEEILSVSPFATLFYDVISDEENEAMRNKVTKNLYRGKVGGDKLSYVSEVRTSDLAWIWDIESETAVRVSQRIEQITRLNLEQKYEEKAATSSEAFQVVNYGLGGHYEVHMDPFEEKSQKPELAEAGERIATFLIYLSDVERGGSTVFTRVGVAAAPKKNMALFWYNYKPNMSQDTDTHHAGCPVLIGQKWITNKWVWTYGNTFTRRCGLNPDDDQLDIEERMENNWK